MHTFFILLQPLVNRYIQESTHLHIRHAMDMMEGSSDMSLTYFRPLQRRFPSYTPGRLLKECRGLEASVRGPLVSILLTFESLRMHKRLLQ